MSELPWFKMNAADYLGDIKLKRCSFAARGVYIELLCIAFQCDERGVFITEGIVWTKDEILRSIAGDINEISAAWDELVRWKRFKQRDDGAYYNSRLVRDEAERSGNAKRQADQRKRENQQRNSYTTNNTKVTPIVTEEVTAKVTPEVTVQSIRVLEEESLRVLEEKNLRVEEETREEIQNPSTSTNENSFEKPEKQNQEAIHQPREEIPPGSAPPPLPPDQQSKLTAGWVWIEQWYKSTLADQIYLADIARVAGLAESVQTADSLSRLVGPWLRRFVKDQQSTEGEKNFLVRTTDKRKHFKSWMLLMDMTLDPVTAKDLRKSKSEKNGSDQYDSGWAYTKLGISKPGSPHSAEPYREEETTWEPVQSEGGS